MSTHQHLPTWISGEWSIASFRDTLVSTLQSDRSCTSLTLYFYAVTLAGWEQVREPLLQWMQRSVKRKILLYVGTDHGITDPSALAQIAKDGVEVFFMLEYRGVFHPKVIWLQGKTRNVVWVGSNNLTRDGLLNNVEFALLVRSKNKPKQLSQWSKSVKSASRILTDGLLKSYESQRNAFHKSRGDSKATTFTWKKRKEPRKKKTISKDIVGSLIVEVMPRETQKDGRQIQLPLKAAASFFGVEGVGSSRTVHVRPNDIPTYTKHIMTVFHNHTVRLIIGDLEYRDRPCVLVFRKENKNHFVYEIVSESIFPSRYKELLLSCNEQTRRHARRWGMP